MNGVGDDSRGRILGRPWLVVGFLLALAATAALVFGDDARWLRLGILAALWAALLGAFLAVRYRRQAAQTEDSVERAQEVYELELEREIAARREHELEVEAETRQRVERDSRAEIEALRSEVTALRESLQSLFGGEVLYERVALTAQSTRMRSLQDERRVVQTPEPAAEPAPGRLERGPQNPEGSERPTDLIEHVREAGAAAQQNRASRPNSAPTDMRSALAGAQDAPAARPAPPGRQQKPSAGAGSAAARAAAAAGKARAENAGAPRPAGEQAAGRSEQAGPHRQSTPAASGEAARSAASPASGRTRRPPSPQPPVPAEPERADPQPAAASDDVGRQHESANSYIQDWTPSWEAEQAGDHHLREEPEEPVEEETNSTLPESVRAIQREGRPGGRRRRLDQEDELGEPAEAGAEPADAGGAAEGHSGFEPASGPGEESPSAGGRRRRAEGAPTWQDVVGRENLTETAETSNGARASTSTASREADAASPDEQDAGEQGPPAGSHTEGLSVSELLAAHGSSESTPRRRRRAED